MCMHMYVCIHVCTYICMYIHRYALMHVRTYVCMHVLKYVCIYVRKLTQASGELDLLHTRLVSHLAEEEARVKVCM